MNILIVSATSFEIAPLLSSITEQQKISEQLTTYTYATHTIYVLVTGVGMVNTTYWLTHTLAQHSFDVVLNIGIAGSFTPNYAVGSVVNVVSDCFAEMGAQAGDEFITMERLGFMQANELRVNVHYSSNNGHLNALPKVKGITVNTVHGNAIAINNVIQLFAPDVETMEGAAVLYVCGKQKLQVIQLRAISNMVEVRNPNNWNVPLAINNLNAYVMSLLGEM
ncbi:MAG: futalosine hydrolase [Bacteroidia bacterium]|nr:futalosine hydrolase [Bacteroidia bacterium]